MKMETIFRSPRVRRLKPVHWFLVFVFFVLTLAWMLMDTTTGISYRHSVRHSEPAARVLHLDDDYRKKLQSLDTYMQQYCDRCSDIVYGHNLLVNDMIFNDYVFHVCGGQTWLNAKITIKRVGRRPQALFPATNGFKIPKMRKNEIALGS